MIKAPSLQSTYTLIWSGDPALDLPEIPEAGKAEEKEAVQKERQRILRNARLTGNWPLKGSEPPTVFHFRNLSRSDLAWLTGEMEHSSEHGRPLSQLEANDLMIRLALERVDNLNGLQVKHAKLGSQKRVALPDVLNAIHSAGGELGAVILAELGTLVLERASNQLDPLS